MSDVGYGEVSPPKRPRFDVRGAARDLAGRAREGVRELVADGRFTVVLLLLALIGNALVLPVPGVVILAAAALLGAVLSGYNPITLVVLYVVTIFVVPARYAFLGLSTSMVLGLAAGVLWLLVRAVNGPAPTRRGQRVNRWLAIFVVAKILTYANAQLHFRDAVRIEAADRQLLVFVAFVGIALYVTELVRDWRRLGLVINMVVAGAAFLALAAIVEQVLAVAVADWLRPPGFAIGGRTDGGGVLLAPERFGVQRIFGTAAGPLEFAAMLAACLPLAAHLARHGSSAFQQRLGQTAGFLIIVALPMSVSRTAVVGFFLAGLLVVLGLEKRVRSRAMMGFAAAMAVLVIAFPAVGNAFWGLLGDFTGRQESSVGIEGRIEDYDVIVDLVRERPVLGMGLGVHDPTVPRLVGEQRVRNLFIDNQYLSELVGGGMVGLVALVALPMAGIGAARRARRLAIDPRDAHLAYSVASSLAVLAVTWAFYDSFSFRSSTGLFFLLLGMAGALEANVAGRDSAPLPGEPVGIPARTAAGARR